MAESWNDPIRAAMAPLIQNRGWVRGLAALHFVLGGILVLTVIGGLLAAYFFWVGAVLWQGASALDQAARDRAAGDEPLVRAMDRLAFHFLLQVGFLMLCAILALAWRLFA